MYRSIIAVAAIILGAASASAQTRADRPGLASTPALVQAICGDCHATGVDPHATSAAARLIDIARMPSTTELSLKVFMRSSHRNMPNFVMSAEEIDAVAAYILGLAQK